MVSESENSAYRRASVGRSGSFRSPGLGFAAARPPARRDETPLGRNG